MIVWPVQSDKSGHVIAEVYVSAPTQEQPELEKLLNGEQVAAELASISEPSCPNQAVLSEIATQAKAQKRGLWATNQ